MSFTIRAALDSLIAIQAALSITDPASLSIAQAYKTVPNQKATPETPCFINIPRLMRLSLIAGARSQLWQVRSQLLIEDADVDIATDVVLAFVTKYLDALTDAVTLNGLPVILGQVSSSDLTGFEYGGKRYPGIEITQPLSVPLEAVTVGP